MISDNLEREFSDYASITKIVSEIDEEMVTPADIQHGIQAVSSVLTTLQRAGEIAKKTKNTEISEIITDLRGEVVETKNFLVDTKSEMVELKEKNLQLENQIKSLESSRSSQTLIKADNGLFYESDERQHAFCPSCWLGDSPRRSLLTRINTVSNLYTYKCNTCDWSVSIREGDPPPKVPRRKTNNRRRINPYTNRPYGDF